VGESLFLYTDGLSECRNADGEEYGNRRLFHFLEEKARDGGAPSLLSCLDDLESFRGVSQITDDLSLMLITRSE
jgi:sigma-B regulation protein RsbU (phosphoserine phosphatase)